MKKALQKKYIVTTIILFAVCILVISLRQEKSTEISYQEISVQKADLSETVSATGEVKPKNRLELKPPVAGRIEELLVNEGEFVEKGRIIGSFSSTERVALIDTARAKGEQELKRWKELYRAIPLVAPISGTVISRDAEPGQTISLSDTILTFSDKLTIKVQVDETDVASILKGQRVKVTLDAYPDRPINGTVDHVAFDATISDNVRIYEVEVNPEDPPTYMKSGMGVEAIFYTETRKDVLVIPTSSIQYDTQGAFLYQKKNERTYDKRYLQLGVQSGEKVEILAGANAGDKLYFPQVSFDGNKTTNGANPFLPKRPDRKKAK